MECEGSGQWAARELGYVGAGQLRTVGFEEKDRAARELINDML